MGVTTLGDGGRREVCGSVVGGRRRRGSFGGMWQQLRPALSGPDREGAGHGQPNRRRRDSAPRTTGGYRPHAGCDAPAPSQGSVERAPGQRVAVGLRHLVGRQRPRSGVLYGRPGDRRLQRPSGARGDPGPEHHVSRNRDRRPDARLGRSVSIQRRRRGDGAGYRPERVRPIRGERCAGDGDLGDGDHALSGDPDLPGAGTGDAPGPRRGRPDQRHHRHVCSFERGGPAGRGRLCLDRPGAAPQLRDVSRGGAHRGGVSGSAAKRVARRGRHYQLPGRG